MNEIIEHNEIVEHLEKESRNYIGQAIAEIDPEYVDAAVEAMQADMFVGAQILIHKLIDKFTSEEMNHWELKQELEDVRHHLAMKISPPPAPPRETDEFLNEVIKHFGNTGEISRTEIQRKWKLGYFRAGRILQQIAERNLIEKDEKLK